MHSQAASRIAHLYGEAIAEDEYEDEDEGEPAGPDGANRSGAARRPPRDDRFRQLEDSLMAGRSSVDPNLIVWMELMKMVREMREDDRRGKSDAHEWGDEDAELGRSGSTNLGRAVRGMERHRARMRNAPRQVCDTFREDVKAELHFRPGDHWTYMDLHRRITWGHYTSLQRCYYLLTAVIQELDDGRPLAAQALATQSEKACHQSALSGGN